MTTSDPQGIRIRAELANGHLPTNGTSHVWRDPSHDEMAYRCTTCGGAFSAERTFQGHDGLYYCVEHILDEMGGCASKSNGSSPQRTSRKCEPEANGVPSGM
jgi:hypothetical protein